jgi:hypothetical protein
MALILQDTDLERGALPQPAAEEVGSLAAG